ncbi:MAG: rod-binding protein [Thermoguttaceae bacterium]
MEITSINSSLWTAQSSEGPKFRNTSSSADFADVLQNAVQTKKKRSEQGPDTFESTTASEPTKLSENSTPLANRSMHTKARKLDEDGTFIDPANPSRQNNEEEFRKVFHQFAGQTLYGQMLKSMRETQQKPAFFHGGRAEEIFQGQLDQVIVEKMTNATSDTLSDTMFRLMKKSSV